MHKNLECKNWKKYIPEPVFDQNPEFSELYEKAWELAHNHIKHIDGMPQTPYMDEGFCDTQILNLTQYGNVILLRRSDLQLLKQENKSLSDLIFAVGRHLDRFRFILNLFLDFTKRMPLTA